MEFLLQLIADLFAGEALVEETENVTKMQHEPLAKVDVEVPVDLQTVTTGVAEEPNFFNVIQFH